MDERVFVIVGASLAGAKAAETLRTAGFSGRIVLIGDETERPYERPPLSKGYLHGADKRDKAFVHPQNWYAEHDIELRLGVRVTELDPAAHLLTLDGAQQLVYDKLLLTTGSTVRRLEAPGGDLAGVRYLRTLPDADTLLAALREARNVVVVGAGWIGMEVAAAARDHGAAVTVVEIDQLPLRRVLGDAVAKIFVAAHQAHGVDFRFGVGVREFRASDGVLASVVLSDDSELPADLVLVGVGIDPAVELAVAGGLTIENGIAADASLRTSDPDIYAAGDVVNAHNPMLARRIRVEHWSNALNSGPLAAHAMLDEDVVYDRVPYFYTDQYGSHPAIGMEYAGWVEPGGFDRVVFRGDPTVRADADPEFIAFWVKDGRVLAGMNVNVWDVQDPIQALVRAGYAGKSVDLVRLADPDVPLEQLLG